MSITQGVLAQSPKSEAHDKVLDNNPDRIGIWKCWFLRRGENRSTRRKTSRSKNENQQQIQPKKDAESGNRTRATLTGGECSQHCIHPCFPHRFPHSLPSLTFSRFPSPITPAAQATVINCPPRFRMTVFNTFCLTQNS